MQVLYQKVFITVSPIMWHELEKPDRAMGADEVDHSVHLHGTGSWDNKANL